MAKVTMPQLGESVAEGTIGKWLKKPGDHVAKYEPLLEVITDKVNAEVPSPFEGVLTEILVEEGATVPNNAEIAVIEEAAGSNGAKAPAAAAATTAATTTDARPRSGRLGRAPAAPGDAAAGELARSSSPDPDADGRCRARRRPANCPAAPTRG